MYVIILNNKKDVCLLDSKSKRHNMYFAYCGKEYNKINCMLLSLDQKIPNICSMCKRHVDYLYGTPESTLFHNNNQQHIILSQFDYWNKISSLKKKINLFSITINKIKRVYESK